MNPEMNTNMTATTGADMGATPPAPATQTPRIPGAADGATAGGKSVAVGTAVASAITPGSPKIASGKS